MQPEQALVALGWSENEAKLYLACLGKGVSVSEAARRSSIKRPTVYHYLERLQARGLLHKAVRGRRVIYVAIQPGRLLKVFDEQRSLLESVMSDLESLYRAKGSHSPRVTSYEGKENVLAAYEEVFATSQTIHAVFSPRQFLLAFSVQEDAKLFTLLKSNGGRIHDLLEDNPEARRYSRYPFRKGLSQTKFLPPGYDCPIDLLVAGDVVALVSFRTITATVIVNPDIAEGMRSILKVIWNLV